MCVCVRVCVRMALVLINKNTYQEQVKKLLTGVWTDCSDCLQILGKPVAFGSSHVVAKELKSCPVLFKSTFCYILFFHPVTDFYSQTEMDTFIFPQ